MIDVKRAFSMEIEIGGVSKKDLHDRLRDSEFCIGHSARSIMEKDAFTVFPEKKIIKIEVFDLKDLGFDGLFTTIEAKQRIMEVGRQLCPAELGPHLREKFAGTLKGDCLHVLMDPILDFRDKLVMFFVEDSDRGDRWLSAYEATDSTQWRPVGHIVCVVPENMGS